MNTQWNYKNGLPTLKKAKLHAEFEFLDNEEVYTTNIDGFPYVLYDGDYLEGDKVAFHGEFGMYTVKNIDHDKKHVELKMDKVLQLNDRTVEAMKSHYIGWGMTKEADKVKPNYLFESWVYDKEMKDCTIKKLEFVIDGKLSKNQNIQHQGIHKITDIQKNEDGLFEIFAEQYVTTTIFQLYPYIKNGEVICWYEDVGMVWMRQCLIN